MLRSSIDARIPDGLPRGIALEAPVGKPMASSATAATTVMNVIKRLRMALLQFCGSTSHSIARVASADASKKGLGASLCSRRREALDRRCYNPIKVVGADGLMRHALLVIERDVALPKPCWIRVEAIGDLVQKIWEELVGEKNTFRHLAGCRKRGAHRARLPRSANFHDDDRTG